MADTLSVEGRSALMRRIGRFNTAPEVIVRKALHKRGLRFRLHTKSLPGSPDLVFPKYLTVLFVHGCFWHRHNCNLASTPKSNSDFWQQKFDQNVRRDRRKAAQLRRLGLRVIVVWQCKLMRPSHVTERFFDQLSKKITNNKLSIKSRENSKN